MNRPRTSKDIGLVIEKIPTNKCPGLGGFGSKFYQTLKEKLAPQLHKLF